MKRKKHIKRRYRLYLLPGFGKEHPMPRRTYSIKDTALTRARELTWWEDETAIISVHDEVRGKTINSYRRGAISVIECGAP